MGIKLDSHFARNTRYVTSCSSVTFANFNLTLIMLGSIFFLYFKPHYSKILIFNVVSHYCNIKKNIVFVNKKTIKTSGLVHTLVPYLVQSFPINTFLTFTLHQPYASFRYLPCSVKYSLAKSRQENPSFLKLPIFILVAVVAENSSSFSSSSSSTP